MRKTIPPPQKAISLEVLARFHRLIHDRGTKDERMLCNQCDEPCDLDRVLRAAP